MLQIDIAEDSTDVDHGKWGCTGTDLGNCIVKVSRNLDRRKTHSETQQQCYQAGTHYLPYYRLDGPLFLPFWRDGHACSPGPEDYVSYQGIECYHQDSDRTEDRFDDGDAHEGGVREHGSGSEEIPLLPFKVADVGNCKTQKVEEGKEEYCYYKD